MPKIKKNTNKISKFQTEMRRVQVGPGTNTHNARYDPGKYKPFFFISNLFQ